MATFYGTASKDVVQADETSFDTFYGLGGDDEFYVNDDSSGYEFFGGDGADLISGYAIYATAHGDAGADRINLRGESIGVQSGSGNDMVRVGAQEASVLGQDGNDLLDVLSYPYGGLVDGGAGNDTLLVGAQIQHPADRVVARGGDGNDTISARSDQLPDTVFDGIDANGGAGNDVLTGSDDAEFGADLLYGGAGNDKISGRRGDDKLGGDGGVDTLTGGAGGDVFDFNAGGSGVGVGRRDVVTDFAPGQDTLDLLSIDAKAGQAGDQAFAFVGTRAFSGAGQVRLVRVDGDTVVQGSTDGDAQAEFEVLLANGATPTAGDFDL